MKTSVNPLEHCSGSFSVADFFKDSPWLKVPKDRLGEIIIEPLNPRGRLLGGASKQEGAPKTKLAALAAARRKKETQRSENGQHATSSVALLDKLGGKSQEVQANKNLPSPHETLNKDVAEQTTNVQLRKYPTRKLANQGSEQKGVGFEDSGPRTEAVSQADVVERRETTPAATPSIFAQTMLGFSANAQGPDTDRSDDYALQNPESHTEFDFSGPSPDDVVLKAQSSRPPTQKPAKALTPSNKDSRSVDEASQGVKDVTLEEPKVKGKNLDVLAEFEKSKPKNAANFVVIG